MITPDAVLLATVAVLVAAGIFLVLERSLTRIVLGVLLLGNGINLLILTAGGPTGEPPILGSAMTRRMSDPLPQIMVLTAIVITLALMSFLLALAHRSRQLTGNDEVRDDDEDRRVILRAAREEARLRLREEIERIRQAATEQGLHAERRTRREVRAAVRRERRELRRRLRAEWERQMAADDPDRAIDSTMGEDAR